MANCPEPKFDVDVPSLVLAMSTVRRLARKVDAEPLAVLAEIDRVATEALAEMRLTTPKEASGG